MKSGIPKISVLIICYKQEELIKRAVNSLLAQKDYIYEICVSDDCSPDKTWDVLQEYSKQYPGLFKLHQNNPNIGIFENIEYTWTMPTGDIIYQLAGDDECGEGWFKTVIEYITTNNIDYKNEYFCIYGDYEIVFSNKDSIVFKNNFVDTKRNVLSSAIRGYISNRSTCYSIKILREFKKVSRGRSHIAELIQDRLLQVFSKKNYYIQRVGNRYFAEIGVSYKMNIETLREREKIRPYAIEKFTELGVKLKTSDIFFMLYQKEKISYKLGCKNFYKRCVYRLRAFSPTFLFGKNHFKRFYFLALRKFKHNKPLKLYY